MLIFSWIQWILPEMLVLPVDDNQPSLVPAFPFPNHHSAIEFLQRHFWHYHLHMAIATQIFLSSLVCCCDNKSPLKNQGTPSVGLSTTEMKEITSSYRVFFSFLSFTSLLVNSSLLVLSHGSVGKNNLEITKCFTELWLRCYLSITEIKWSKIWGLKKNHFFWWQIHLRISFAAKLNVCF